MRIIQKTILLLLLTAFITGCASDTDSGLAFPDEGNAVFLIRTGGKPGISVGTRGDSTEIRLNELTYVIADSHGDIIDPHTCRLAPDFSSLTIEGLAHGDYTISFLGRSGEENGATTLEPAHIGDEWLGNTAEGSPADGEYLFGSVSFSIGKEQKPVTQEVCLEFCVGKVNIDLKMQSDYQWRFIKSITLTLDNGSVVPAVLNADGTFSGESHIEAYDVTDRLSFCSFPSEVPLSGFVDITSRRSDGTEFSTRYRFEDCLIEAGKISHINIEYRHPESDDGRIYVREEDFGKFDTDTMFLADEPKEVFYDSRIRSFRVNAPLQAYLTEDRELGIRFFSPVEIKNARILCRFGKVSPEFLEIARFESVYPFMEGKFKLPVAERDATFTASDGRKIRIPAQKELSPDDVTFLIECDDPFMKKISEIECAWYIRFSGYSTDAGHAYWRHMTPLLCRHGVALALNMAFMFASDEFNIELDKYDGILYDNGKNPINLDSLRARIKAHGGLVLGRVVGVGGLGGGSTYGLADYCYTGVYFDPDYPNANPHNYARQAMFHEYGHCLGYSHSSNMTYGDKWTVLCANVFVSLSREGKLPVSTRDMVESLPM